MARVDLVDREGKSALTHAVSARRPKCAFLLWAAGASSNPSAYKTTGLCIPPLMAATKQGDLYFVMQLLSSKNTQKTTRPISFLHSPAKSLCCLICCRRNTPMNALRSAACVGSGAQPPISPCRHTVHRHTQQI